MRSLRAWSSVVILMILQATALLDRNILSLMIIEVKRDLNLTDLQVSLLHGLTFTVFYCVAALFVGKFVDTYPAKKILFACVAIWSAAAVACGVVKDYSNMMFARMVTGLGEGGVNPAAQVLIASMFRRTKVSLPMSLFVLSGALGIGLSYFGGGLLLDALTRNPLPGLESFAPWRQVIIIAAAPGMLLAFLSFALPDTRPKQAASSPAPGWQAMGQFLSEERKLFMRLAMGYALNGIVAYGVFSWAPTYGRRVLGLTPSEIGAQMGLISTVGAILAASAYGYIVDWQYARGQKDFVMRATAIGALLATPVCVLAFLADSLFVFLLGVIAVQVFFSAALGPAAAAIQIVTPVEMRGRMAALLLAVVNLAGYAIGPMIIGATTDFAFKDAEQVGKSIAFVVAVCGPLSALCIWTARGHFVRRIDQVEATASITEPSFDRKVKDQSPIVQSTP